MSEWTLVHKAFIEGKPMPQPRPRFSFKTKRAYTAKTKSGGLEKWKWHLTRGFNRAGLNIAKGVPVKLVMRFKMFRSQAFCKKKYQDEEMPHVGHVDIDNLIKPVMDAMTKCDVWRDDCQVCRIMSDKNYRAKDGRMGIYIEIYTWK